MVYIENHKESTIMFLELISEFSKVIGYKTNLRTSNIFLYTNNEYAGIKIKNAIAQNCTKIQFRKHMKQKTNIQDLCAEVYKMLNKEIKNTYHVHGFENPTY